MGVVLVVVIVILTGSMIQALRSRAKVKAMLSEPTTPAPTCAIHRPGAQRFFDETRLLRATVEERIAMPAAGAADLIHDDVDPAMLASEHARRVADWVSMYSEQLDEEDRTELEHRGITPGLIQKMAMGAHINHPIPLRRFLADIRFVEERMATQTRTGIYR